MSGQIIAAFSRRDAICLGRKPALAILMGVAVNAAADSFPLIAGTKGKRRKKNRRDRRCPDEETECRQFVVRFCDLIFPDDIDACVHDLSRCCDPVAACKFDEGGACLADLIGAG